MGTERIAISKSKSSALSVQKKKATKSPFSRRSFSESDNESTSDDFFPVSGSGMELDWENIPIDAPESTPQVQGKEETEKKDIQAKTEPEVGSEMELDYESIPVDMSDLKPRIQAKEETDKKDIQTYETPVGGEVEKEEQILTDGHWTTHDRETNSQRWQNACLYNLKNGNSAAYVRIEQRRNFYRWFYEYHAEKGYTTRWALAASIVANGAHQIAYPLSSGFGELGARLTRSISNELQGFMRIGNQIIFDDVFPKLKQLHDGGPLTGKVALEWDMQILSEEQQLIQPLYEQVSTETREQLKAISQQSGFGVKLGSLLTTEDTVDKGKYNVEGDVPAFPQDKQINSVDDRWHYGMHLGNQFAPSKTGYNEKDMRPKPRDKYTNGEALAKVNVRYNLHMLDAQLETLGLADVSTVDSLLRQLKPQEKEELAKDYSPDGFRYSSKLSMMPRLKRSSVKAGLPPNGKAREKFLQNFDRYHHYRP